VTDTYPVSLRLTKHSLLGILVLVPRREYSGRNTILLPLPYTRFLLDCVFVTVPALLNAPPHEACDWNVRRGRDSREAFVLLLCQEYRCTDVVLWIGPFGFGQLGYTPAAIYSISIC